jgi:hypothetical protein
MKTKLLVFILTTVFAAGFALNQGMQTAKSAASTSVSHVSALVVGNSTCKVPANFKTLVGIKDQGVLLYGVSLVNVIDEYNNWVVMVDVANKTNWSSKSYINPPVDFDQVKTYYNNTITISLDKSSKTFTISYPHQDEKCELVAIE